MTIILQLYLVLLVLHHNHIYQLIFCPHLIIQPIISVKAQINEVAN